MRSLRILAIAVAVFGLLAYTVTLGIYALTKYGDALARFRLRPERLCWSSTHLRCAAQSHFLHCRWDQL